MNRRAVGKRIDVLLDALRVDMHQQIHTNLFRHIVAEFIHGPELPAGINVQQRERRRRRCKGFAGQVQHDRRVFANGIKHYRVFSLGNHFAHDLNAFRFQSL